MVRPPAPSHLLEPLYGVLCEPCSWTKFLDGLTQEFTGTGTVRSSGSPIRTWQIPMSTSMTERIARVERRLSMQFRPLHDRVVVRRIESEGKTAGGIIIPDTAKEKPQEGEVIA